MPLRLSEAGVAAAHCPIVCGVQMFGEQNLNPRPVVSLHVSDQCSGTASKIHRAKAKSCSGPPTKLVPTQLGVSPLSSGELNRPPGLRLGGGHTLAGPGAMAQLTSWPVLLIIVWGHVSYLNLQKKCTKNQCGIAGPPEIDNCQTIMAVSPVCGGDGAGSFRRGRPTSGGRQCRFRFLPNWVHLVPGGREKVCGNLARALRPFRRRAGAAA